MSPITFVATGNAVKYNKAKIIFVDVDLKNYGMCPDALERVLKSIALVKKNYCLHKKNKKRISCILPTHVFGISCDIIKIKKIADKFKIPIVEDAAEGLSSFYKGKHLGLYGKVGILSFNGNKIITTGSGGAIITNSKRIYDKIYHLACVSKKNHPWKFYHDEVGYNYRMNNMSAALGAAQISNIKYKIKYKKKLYQLILKKFSKLKNEIKFYKPNISLLKWNYWLISLKIKNSLKVRNDILDDFNKNGIQIRPLWEPLNTLPHFKNDVKFNLKNSLELYNETILLPSSPQLYKKILND
jgi:dTDP-4-amino-4,6-dideoxygalactose transaminase